MLGVTHQFTSLSCSGKELPQVFPGSAGSVEVTDLIPLLEQLRH